MGKYFCFDGNTFDTYSTLEEAKAEAQKALELFADEAGDGWDEMVEQVCYGELKGEVVETNCRPKNDNDFGVDSCIDMIVEYALCDVPPVAS